jgi:tRNA-dependent cyclodipeptide synthase
LPISVGNKYFEDTKFNNLIKIVNNNFDYCNIVVADTLQRHNFALKNIIEPTKYSYNLGTEWIERNKNHISKFNIKHNILRWEDFLTSSEYDYMQNKTYKLFSTNLNFKNAVEYDVNKYCKNYIKHNSDLLKIDEYILSEVSTTYILEECCVMQLFNNLDCKYIVYPGKLPESFSHINSNLEFVKLKKIKKN